MPPSERRRLASSAAGVLLSKSVQMSGEVHLAMRSRGFRGEIQLSRIFAPERPTGVGLPGSSPGRCRHLVGRERPK